MKLTVFRSGEGDCLLLQSRDGKSMLVDGGMAGSYHDHAAAALAKLAQLDLICVSHIDNDHIGGIVALMDDAFKWRVHQLHLDKGDMGHRAPSVIQPPKVLELWHNGFGAQLGDGAVKIAGVLAASAARLDFGTAEDTWEASRYRAVANSVPQGIELSQRVSAAQLGIPLNKAFGGKLALVRKGAKPIKLGSVTLTVIGPFEEDLANLRKEWKAFLDDPKNKAALENLRKRMSEDVKSLELGDVELFRGALAAQADEIGVRTEVTAPNLASLMLLAREDNGKTVLLTGDGHADDIIKGLERSGDLPKNGSIHVDVLKIQHHGARANITDEFCERVTADNYVICSDGANDNPDPPTLKALFKARLVDGGKPFKLWFNSRANVVAAGDKRTRMADVEATVRKAAQQQPKLLSFEFLEKSSFDLKL
jgi:beta-lactamase superfamily II metal-dependent hydrolase